jgi:hypothetical protein
MEGRPRRSFTEDYKRQAAELVVSSGRSITSIAKELDLRDSVLRLGGAVIAEFVHEETYARSRRANHFG